MNSKVLRYVLVAHASIVLAPCARPDVLEIQPDGRVIMFEGPTAHVGDDVRAIQPVDVAKPYPKRAPQEATALYFNAAAAKQELSPRLLEAVAYVESRFNDDAVSPTGAVGAMQLMPATAAELGVDPSIPSENIQGGASYLRQMLELFDGDLTLALAAYNAGPGAVRRYGAVPPFEETQEYVEAVLSYMADVASMESRQ
ncbi:lytic transglycosylase domain-containing protein [Hyphomonas sp.]|uniref:lytic transglycosylase domain-containing protein n=1 Tax=Hyphomonas sp. TaxID=87 RepID=UPI0033400378